MPLTTNISASWLSLIVSAAAYSISWTTWLLDLSTLSTLLPVLFFEAVEWYLTPRPMIEDDLSFLSPDVLYRDRSMLFLTPDPMMELLADSADLFLLATSRAFLLSWLLAGLAVDIFLMRGMEVLD